MRQPNQVKTQAATAGKKKGLREVSTQLGEYFKNNVARRQIEN